jgi:hypothetical protein
MRYRLGLRTMQHWSLTLYKMLAKQLTEVRFDSNASEFNRVVLALSCKGDGQNWTPLLSRGSARAVSLVSFCVGQRRVFVLGSTRKRI